MRNLKINEKTLYVLNFNGTVEVRDEFGNLTSETVNSYSDPIEFKASVSGARGSSQIEIFGSEINYDKTIVLSKKRYGCLGMDENSVLFVGKKPSYDANYFPEYNYRVERIAESVNEVAIAISKVKAD